MSDSDQIEPEDDGLEIELGEEVLEEEQSESEADDQGDEEEESEGGEQVPAEKKESGYVEFDEKQKARVDEITRKRYAAERERDELKRELQQYKKPPEAPREIPAPTADPVTDPDLYVRQQQAREQYVREHTIYEANAQASQQQKQAAEAERFGSLVEKYNKNVTRLGISTKVLAEADKTLTSAGISKDLIEFLLDEDDGPALVAHLGANPDDAEAIIRMPSLKVGAFIERQIRSKLKSKPVSKAPQPPTTVRGTRPTKGVEIDGTTYE